MKKLFILLSALLLGLGVEASSPQVRGINLLSSDFDKDTLAISAAAVSGINHIQISHRMVHSLCEIRAPWKCDLVSSLASFAHEKGISDVLLWDHALYNTDYYPDRYKYPGTGLLNLDNPGFWQWMKNDYREMLDMCPEVDGLVLTFIESGARVEVQYSSMTIPERLAKVINTVAEVVCGEYGKKLWLRTFAYNEQEYTNIVDCFDLVEWDDDRMFLMVKDVPHDFFIYHPDNGYIGRLGHPTLVEFDACGEYNGQSVILNTMPQYFSERWNRYVQMPEVMGYVARTSRFNDTEITGTPAEINLFALKRATDQPGIDSETVYDEYIAARYGARAVRLLKPAFKASADFIDGTMYILKLNTTHHSDFSLEDWSTYSRHVSGRWLSDSTVFIGRGINRRLRWWDDIVNTLAPVRCKKDLPDRYRVDIPEVLSSGALNNAEDMNEQYLDYIIKWTNDCHRKASKGSRKLKRAEHLLSGADYAQLYDIYQRSLMCLDLRRYAAVCYWGSRVWNRGEEFQTMSLKRKINRAVRHLEKVLKGYEAYDKPYPVGTWDWKKDTETARLFLEQARAAIL